jgi:putative addiction module killer protein
MFIIKKTESFEKWITKLRDINGKARVLSRLKRVELGNLGDYKSLGSGISEMRIDCGPGYRLYFARREGIVIVLLVGGDKTTQVHDIQKARQILTELGVSNG